MKILPLLALVALGPISLMSRPVHAQEARPELRAFWADAFNPGFKSPQEVDELLQRLHDAHLNAIFAQVRKRGDAYYQSHYEPWASDDVSHFDALAYLIQRAHQMNPPIAVHAWINACAVGGTKSPFNIVHQHPEWISLNSQNADYDGEATKIDPGNPEAADWTFRVYLDVVRHYNVDGIHFDFVRYGGREWGYNPASVARFRQQHGAEKDIHWIPGTEAPDPTDPTWQQWRRDQVTALVRKVYAHAVAINPNIVVSAAVIAWGGAPKNDEDWLTKSAAMTRVYQDWRGWLQEHILDLACPMTYFRAERGVDQQRDWAEFVKDHQYGRAATVGVGVWFNTIAQSISLIAVSRESSSKNHWPYGVMLYSYSGTNASETKDEAGHRTEMQLQPDFYAALSHASPQNNGAPPFPSDTPIPEMSWKTNPERGHLKGFILEPHLNPLDGAVVTIRAGRKILSRRTDGTGFYAFIDVPPGDYALSAEMPGFSSEHSSVKVAGGRVTTATVTLGGASVPETSGIGALQGHIPGLANGAPVRLADLLVTLGSDTFPGNLYVSDREGRGMRVRLAAPPLVPFQRGDVVSVTGTLTSVDGERTIDRAAVVLTDIRPLGALPATPPATGTHLISDATLAGTAVRIQGRVTAVSPDGFTVDDGQPVRVLVGGLKEFEVEATALATALPPIGARVSVAGLASVALSPDGKTRTAQLRPRGASDVVVLPNISLWRTLGVPGGALAFFRRSPGVAQPK